MELGSTLYGLMERFIMDDGYGFEGVFRELNRQGIRKFELMGAQMFQNYPNPAKSEIEACLAAAEKYRTEPYVYAGCVDRGKRPDRDMTDDEMMNEVVFDLMTAHKLGCKYLRENGIPFHLYPRAAAMAGFYEVKVCCELKTMVGENSDDAKAFIKMADELKTPWLGLAPQFGCFMRGEGQSQLADTEMLGKLLPYTAYFYGSTGSDDKDSSGKTEAFRQIADFIIQSGWRGTVMAEYRDLSSMETILREE